MIIDCNNYKDKNKDFSFINIILVIVFQPFKFLKYNKSLLKFEILQIKCKAIVIFKKVERIANNDLFSFSLDLRMEDN